MTIDLFTKLPLSHHIFSIIFCDKIFQFCNPERKKKKKISRKEKKKKILGPKKNIMIILFLFLSFFRLPKRKSSKVNLSLNLNPMDNLVKHEEKTFLYETQ